MFLNLPAIIRPGYTPAELRLCRRQYVGGQG